MKNAGCRESRNRGDFSGLSHKLKVEIVAATPRKEEERDQRRAVGK